MFLRNTSYRTQYVQLCFKLALKRSVTLDFRHREFHGFAGDDFVGGVGGRARHNGQADEDDGRRWRPRSARARRQQSERRREIPRLRSRPRRADVIT
jgi:hypothetical protein